MGWGMKQLTLATAFDRYAKTTRRAAFLGEMERVVPWSALCALIEPFYPMPGNGRPPLGIERMLRIYFLQHWFNLSDPAVEEALYDSQAMRRFVGIDPEMHQTKKGNQWYFGMKGHFGVDSRSELIHAVQATPANVADSTVLPNLLHGNETPRVARPSVSRPAGRDQGACASGAGFHQSPLPPPWCCR
jgi:hypothetical protein